MDLLSSCCSSTYAAILLLAVGLYLFRKWCIGPKCRSHAHLDGKIVIITGSNTGIGKVTAIDLAKRGATIVMACRNLDKGAKAMAEVREISNNSNVFLMKLDLSSLESIKEFAESFLKEYRKLHILINNAGVMWCDYMKTKDGFEMQFGTNHLGPFALTNLLLVRLKESGPSRVVNLSSMAHGERYGGHINFDDLNSEKSYSPTDAYGQSKLANVLFTRELAKKLADTEVTTYSVHPGYVMTDLQRHSILTNIFTYTVGYIICKPPVYGAQTSIHCAVQEGIEKESGNYYKDCHMANSSKTSMNDGYAKKLWEVSEQMTGVNFPL